MTDRIPPQVQLWTWPTHLEPGRITRSAATPATPVRIGDAERDRAVSSLGDHFAAGRLTREEFDTRVDQAMVARFDNDLRPLFVDLPRSEAPTPGPAYATAPGMRSAWPLMLMWWLPFLLVGSIVAAVLIGAPWLIWGVIWVMVMTSLLGRRRPHRGYRYYR